MIRLTKRLEVLIETRESIIAHPTPSSPPLQFWLIGVQASFGTNFSPERHLLKDCVHVWGSTSNLCTVNKENDAFQACQGRKTRRMFKEECVWFQKDSTKNVCNKSYWCCKFRLLKLQYRPVLWDKMTVKQNPRKNGSVRSRQMGRFRKWNYRFWEKGGTGNLYHGNLTAPWQREDKSAPILVTASWSA